MLNETGGCALVAACLGVLMLMLWCTVVQVRSWLGLG